MSLRSRIEKIIVTTATPLINQAVETAVDRINQNQPTMGIVQSISGAIMTIKLPNGSTVTALSSGSRPIGLNEAVSIIGGRIY